MTSPVDLPEIITTTNAASAAQKKTVLDYLIDVETGRSWSDLGRALPAP